jgi:hypothetical protein
MTLSCSRHQYAELVSDQSVATWLRLHRAAFQFFGGVSRRIQPAGPPECERQERVLPVPFSSKDFTDPWCGAILWAGFQVSTTGRFWMRIPAIVNTAIAPS